MQQDPHHPGTDPLTHPPGKLSPRAGSAQAPERELHSSLYNLEEKGNDLSTKGVLEAEDSVYQSKMGQEACEAPLLVLGSLCLLTSVGQGAII